MLSFTGIALIDFIVTKYVEYMNKKKRRNDELIINPNHDVAVSLLSDENKTKSLSKRNKLFLILSYSFIAAYFGSYNVLLMKTCAILFYYFELDYFEDWFFWVIAVAVITCNFLLEYFRQRALKYFDAIIVIPVYQVFLLIGSILMGAMYFGEFKSVPLNELGLFVLSIMVILVGIVMMAL